MRSRTIEKCGECFALSQSHKSALLFVHSRKRERKPIQNRVAKVAANVFFGLRLVSFVRSFFLSILISCSYCYRICLFVYFVIMILNLLEWTRLTFFSANDNRISGKRRLQKRTYIETILWNKNSIIDNICNLRVTIQYIFTPSRPLLWANEFSKEASIFKWQKSKFIY